MSPRHSRDKELVFENKESPLARRTFLFEPSLKNKNAKK